MQTFLTYAPRNLWDAQIPAGLKRLMLNVQAISSNKVGLTTKIGQIRNEHYQDCCQVYKRALAAPIGHDQRNV